MEVHDLEMLTAVKGAYDCDSESEGFVDDSVDDVLSYGSGDIPKLQFRKEASRARWIDELGMAEVVENKGKIWTTTGIVRSGKIYCSIEETLFLVEIGALDVLNGDGAPLSVSDMYRKIAEDRSGYGCSWECFEVYRHLKYLGYIVGRHGIPWSLKNVKSDTHAEESSGEFDWTRENGSISSTFITEKLSELQLCETKPIYDVYPPNSKFKKSSPGRPCFVLYLISGRPPSKQEIEILEIRCSGNPLKFCIVEHGRVSGQMEVGDIILDSVETPWELNLGLEVAWDGGYENHGGSGILYLFAIDPFLSGDEDNYHSPDPRYEDLFVVIWWQIG